MVNCPDSLFACYVSAAAGCGMGRGVCNSWRRGMKEHRRSGVHRVTLNNIQTKTHQNATTNLPFFLSPKTLNCLKLVEEDVLCCSAKVCKLAEIKGGDCGDDRKSHRSRVHVKNICAIKIGRSNLHHTLGHTMVLYVPYCTLRYCATYGTVWSAIFVGGY